MLVAQIMAKLVDKSTNLVQVGVEWTKKTSLNVKDTLEPENYWTVTYA